MAVRIFGLASVTAIIDGKEIDLGRAMVRGVELEASGIDIIHSAASGIIGNTYTMRGTVTLTDEGCAFFVGLALRYRLRQLHQEWGRYTRWPCTN